MAQCFGDWDEWDEWDEAASYVRGTILIPKPPQLFLTSWYYVEHYLPTQLDMLLPATITNTYRGAPIAKYVFIVMTVLTVARSLVHIILPDGKLSLLEKVSVFVLFQKSNISRCILSIIQVVHRQLRQYHLTLIHKKHQIQSLQCSLSGDWLS